MLAEVDPMRWAEAGIRFINGGGWIGLALAALALICWKPPWRKTQ